jgi:two-component system cell cycle response regulator
MICQGASPGDCDIVATCEADAVVATPDISAAVVAPPSAPASQPATAQVGDPLTPSGLRLSLFNKEKVWSSLVVQTFSATAWDPQIHACLTAITAQLNIAIEQSELIHQLQEANQELHRIANIDGLTQIANRRYLNHYLNREWLRLRREQQPLTLIMLDIDHFKLYNDTYGHMQGDECLKAVAQALDRTIKRPADLVARYGGEEFIVVLPNTAAAGGITLAQQMQQAVPTLSDFPSDPSFPSICHHQFGNDDCIPSAKTSWQQLIDLADPGALSKPKNQRRNCYVCTPPPARLG